MKIFANKEIKKLFLSVSVIWVVSLLLIQGFLWLRYQQFSLFLLLVSVLAGSMLFLFQKTKSDYGAGSIADQCVS